MDALAHRPKREKERRWGVYGHKGGAYNHVEETEEGRAIKACERAIRNIIQDMAQKSTQLSTILMLERSLFPYEVFHTGKTLTNNYVDGSEQNIFFLDGYNQNIYSELSSKYNTLVKKTEGLPGKPKEQCIGPYTGGLGSKIDFLRVRVLKRVYVKHNEVSYDCSRKGLYWDNTLIMSSESYVRGRKAEDKVTAIRKTEGYDATTKGDIIHVFHIHYELDQDEPTVKKIGLYWIRDPPQDKAMETVDQHREAYNALSQLHKDSVKAWTRIYGDDEWAIFAADVEKGIYITALTSNDRTKKRAAEPVAPASHFAMQEVDLEGSYSPMGSIMQDCNVEQWDRDYIGFLEDFQPTQGVPSSMVWEEGYAGTDHHVQGRPTCYSPITQAMNDQRCSAFYAHPPRRYD